ncbi:MAG: Nif3-like dinuclear metal center hexameric protein [Lachnospiraceae bacterium]|nr:Nif3-like dinuclear metal center hexameric protein [Lachnospiraceae bacterium]
MTVRDIYEIIEKRSPFEEALSWDNSGLLVGDFYQEVSGIYLALDATDEVIENAKSKGCDLIITHHPLIFTKISNITEDDFVGRRVKHLIEHGMSLICMHTNYDIYGMADYAAKKLSLVEPRVLDICGLSGDEEVGIGRIGSLVNEITLRTLADQVKGIFGLKSVKVFGAADEPVRLAAICPGSGKSVVDTAIEQGADVLITGDIDHHTGIDANMRSLSIIDAGHYGIEHIFMEEMETFLTEKIKDIKIFTEPFGEPFWVM